MGIRFERGNGRSTNGPLIFFSLYNDETFNEEIRNALASGFSFYAYRYPNDTMFSFGSSEGYIQGIGERGFVISSFEPSKPIITIPYSGVKKIVQGLKIYEMPAASTTKEEYEREVEAIKKNLNENKDWKVVAARVIIREEKIDIADKFYELCRRFPDAYVFCFSTPATGCWIGASPELLLSGYQNRLETMALAGTRDVGTPGEWDEKNIREQKIVADFIGKILRQNNLNPEYGKTITKSTGKIEHICTPIVSYYDSLDLNNLIKILRELSPTPALCGYPKDFALELISELEHFDRGCYGGFCGPYHSINDFHFNVVIRCASVSEKNYCIYAGGGITCNSDIVKEWEETVLKSNNVFRDNKKAP